MRLAAANEVSAALRSVFLSPMMKHRSEPGRRPSGMLGTRSRAYATHGCKNLRRYPVTGAGGLVRDQAHTSRLSPLIPCKITPE